MTTIKNKNYPIEYAHSIAIENIASLLQANQQNGLSEDEVDKRIEAYGLNSYKAQKQKSIFLLLIEQFKSPIIALLVVAAGFSFSSSTGLKGFLSSE